MANQVRPAWLSSLVKGGPTRAGERIARAKGGAIPGRLKLKGTPATTSAARCICYDATNDRMYIGCSDDKVRVYNASTLALQTTINLTAADSPTTIACSPTSAKVFVGTAAGVRVISTASNTVTATIATGSQAHVMWWDSVLNMLLAMPYNGNIDWINCSTNAITSSSVSGFSNQINYANPPGCTSASDAVAGLGIAYGLVLMMNVDTNRIGCLRTDTRSFIVGPVADGGLAAYSPVMFYSAGYSGRSRRARVSFYVNSASFATGPDSVATYVKGDLSTRTYDIQGGGAAVCLWDDVRRGWWGRSVALIGGVVTWMFTPEVDDPIGSGGGATTVAPPTVRIGIPGHTTLSGGPGYAQQLAINPTTGDLWFCLSNNTLEVVGT